MISSNERIEPSSKTNVRKKKKEKKKGGCNRKEAQIEMVTENKRGQENSES